MALLQIVARAVVPAVLVLVAGCGAERAEDPLSVLPPPCRPWASPGPDGCLFVLEERHRQELRFEDDRGTVATVIDRRATGELRTEVKLNGVTTWTRSAWHGADGRWRESAIFDFEHPSGRLLREQRSRPAPGGNAIETKVRRFGSDGRAAEEAWEAPTPRSAGTDGARATRPLLQSQDCTPYELDVVRADLQRGFRDGVACLRRNGRSDIAAMMLSRYQRGPLVLACVQSRHSPGGDFLAASDGDSYLGVAGATRRLSFDKEAYFRWPQGGRIKTTWHELLHLVTGPHTLSFLRGAQSAEQDRTNACVSICFDYKPGVSRCACELCLGVPPGDARCAGFGACSTGAR
jgi:hypothetical protein